MARKRGAQPGNQNATKHGFYARVLSPAEKRDLEAARRIQGIDDEIALLRVRLLHLLDGYPHRPDLHLQAASTIARLIRTQYQISQDSQRPLRDAIQKVLDDVGIDLGVEPTGKK